MFVLIPVLGPVIAGVGAILGTTVILKGGFYILISTPPPSIAVRLVWVSTTLLGALILALSF